MFDRLREAGLKLKPVKCHFMKDEVEYLVTPDGISADPKKVQAVANFPVPPWLKSGKDSTGATVNSLFSSTKVAWFFPDE